MASWAVEAMAAVEAVVLVVAREAVKTDLEAMVGFEEDAAVAG